MTQYINFKVKNPFMEFEDYMPIDHYEYTDPDEIPDIIYNHFEHRIHSEAQFYEPKRDWTLTKEQYECELEDFYNDFYAGMRITWQPCNEDTNDWLIAYDI